MNDTTPEMASKMHEMMMKKSPEERFMMGCSMFSFAQTIVKSSILEKNKDISQGELKKQLFLRFYGNDMDEKTRDKIADYLLNLDCDSGDLPIPTKGLAPRKMTI